MNGFLAPTMDDKWDFIYEENELCIYRSWTRFGVYKIKFETQAECLKVTETYVDEQFLKQHSIEYCCSLINWLIEVILFKRRIDFPRYE